MKYTTKILIFLFIIFVVSICYGQIPITKEKVLILYTKTTPDSFCENAERAFANTQIRQAMRDKNIQFFVGNGEDLSPDFRKANKITHYPALVYWINGKIVRTISGTQDSVALGNQAQVCNLLGIKAEIYRETPPSTPVNNPLIPGKQSQKWSPSAPLMPSINSGST